MSAYPSTRPGFRNSLILLGLPLLLAGCGSSSPEIQELNPQTISQLPSPTQEDQPVVASNEGFSALDLAPQPVVKPEDQPDDSILPIGPVGRTASSEQDVRLQLREASMRERRRRENSQRPAIVINDKNLTQMAQGGRVTIASQPNPTHSGVTAAPGSAPLTTDQKEELYWRNRVRAARTEWRQAYDEIDTLKTQAADLRRQFYSEDDPWQRDSRIKPEWDRVLDRLDSQRRQVQSSQLQLSAILDEGRRAGALPGWLRDGKELEPRPPAPARGEPYETDTAEPGPYNAQR